MPAGMTSGERMVWAAEFVRSFSVQPDPRRAAMSAFIAVNQLHDAGVDTTLRDDARAMVLDMLGVPR